MKHQHCDHVECEHKEVKYCKKCQVVYCTKCSKEWGQNYYYYYPQTLPYTFTSDTANTTTTTIIPHTNC